MVGHPARCAQRPVRQNLAWVAGSMLRDLRNLETGNSIMPCRQSLSGGFNDYLSQETTAVSNRFIGQFGPPRPTTGLVSGASLELAAQLEPLPLYPTPDH